MPTSHAPCKECGVKFPEDRTTCPHCGRPQLFPNVVRANRAEERDGLDRRYAAALQAAEMAGCRDKVDAFEKACVQSEAMLCCRLEKLLAVAKGERDLFANFYDLLSLRFQKPPRASEPNWDSLRPITEIALLDSDRHYNRIHYANLTLNGRGLPHYGECEVLMREEMIAHRTSTFESNSAVFVDRNGHKIPAGLRSDWTNRARHCVAKLGGQITVKMEEVEFPELMLKAGATGMDDEFVELHVFGELTFHAFRRITVRSAPIPKPSAPNRPRTRRGTAAEKVLRSYCEKTTTNGMSVEFVLV
ncbi:MAG TPA: hypothetical protein VHR66_25815 [Gemmataceae bacterium]|jgi:hypothetical protein|nr:hypothetical protein [Gemmataceae bacterium]